MSACLVNSVKLILLAFSYPFLCSVVFQAQDFYVEMKWEFTSWGDLSLCITNKSNHLN